MLVLGYDLTGFLDLDFVLIRRLALDLNLTLTLKPVRSYQGIFKAIIATT